MLPAGVFPIRFAGFRFEIVLIALWLWAGQLARGQRPLDADLYEGSTVAVVDIAARPDVDIEELRSLIVQKAGAPYSGDAVQRSAQALQNTGKFQKVNVSVTAEASGLRVEFVLEPAYYIGVLSFPGAANRFPYARLLQVASYPPQEPFDRSRVQQAENNLRNFLVDNGYFLARVQSETQLDSANQVANPSFNLSLGRLAKYGNISVTGLDGETAEIESSLHSWRARLKGQSVRSGKSYNAAHLQAALGLIRDRLAQRNRLAAAVTLEPVQYDRESNRADITFHVTPGPIVVVKTDGTNVSAGKLRQLLPIYEENSIDQDLVREGQRNLVSYFQAHGYFDATVEPEVSEQPARIDLTYHINRGKRGRVLDVSIDGNRYFSDEQLRSLIQVRQSSLLSRGRFSNDLVRRSTDAITAKYRDAGFASAAATAKTDNTDGLRVRFEITEGPQTLVDSFQIEGNRNEPAAALASDGLNLGPGKPYSQKLLNQDRDQIVAHYLDLGYLNPSFDSSVTPLPNDPHRVAVRYFITEGPRVLIERTADIGHKQTRNSFIDLISQIRAGQPLRQSELLAAESRLYTEGIFDWVNITPRKPITDQQQELVLVRTVESPRNVLDYGFGFEMSPRTANIPVGTIALPGLRLVGLPNKFSVTQRQFASPRGSVEYSRRNMRGRAETATVAMLMSRLDQRLSLSYAIPHFRSYHWSSSWSLSGERTSENPIYTARLEELSLQFERPLNAAKTQTVLFHYRINRTRLSDVRIPDLVLPQDRDVRLSTASATYVRDTRDKALDAHNGQYQSVDFGLTPRFLGSNTSFVRLLGQTAYYRQMMSSLVWANNLRVGLAKPLGGGEIPISQRYFSGGANSLRGFPFNGAGPQRVVPVCSDSNDPSTCTNITVPVGGNAVFIINSEARFPLPIRKNLGGVVFYDGGNVYERIGFSHFLTDFSNSIGVGLRYDTRVGPIRIDVGRNLSPTPGLKATQVFVTLGQAF